MSSPCYLRKRRKSSFILIEVIIASSLFALLLSVVFGIFWYYSQLNQSLTKQRTSLEKLLIAQSRLQMAFTRSVFHKNCNRYFYIEEPKSDSGPSLIFTFHNIVEMETEFCETVLGKLYVEDEQLCLAMWPHKKNLTQVPTTMQKEHLLSNVTSFEIELFAIPTSKKRQSNKNEVQVPEGKWISRWPVEYKRRPSLIKLTCHRTTGEIVPFWFFIPNETQPIIYGK